MKDFFVPDRYDTAILDFVKEYENCIKTDIYAYIGLTGSNATKKVDRLVNLGLLTEKNYGKYNTKRISTTPKGRMMLKKMIEMDEIMKGRVPISSDTAYQDEEER